MNTSKCPVPQELADYVLGRLPEDSAQAIAQHVEQCEPCEATLSQLEVEGDTLLERIRAAGVAPPCAEEAECWRLIDKLAAEITPGAVRRPAAEAKPIRPRAGRSASPRAAKAAGPAAGLGQIREYRLLEKLGEGGMGVVYKARHAKLDKLVAVKLLSAKVTGDPGHVARFEQEMKAVGKVEHGHVVRAMDAGQIKGRHYLVMEYVDGINLSELVRAAGPLRIADACELARQAALGLQAIDAHGLVHRDVKPSNLMLNAEGQLKILDLGLAVFTTSAGQDAGGQVMGTPDYMAPEQSQGSAEIDIRADLYSLGCTLYKLLTGSAPFSGAKYSTPTSRIAAHVSDPVPAVTSLRSDVPPKLAALVHRLLAKDAALRLPDPGRVADELRPFCGGADLAGLYARTTALPWSAASSATSEAIPHRSAPLAAAMTAMSEVGAAPAVEEFDPYHTWLGIPPEEQPPSHYRLLALQPFEDKRPVIESAVARQSAYLRTLQLGPHLALVQRLLNEVSAAKVCLLIPEKKAAYDAALRQKTERGSRPQGGHADASPPPIAACQSEIQNATGGVVAVLPPPVVGPRRRRRVPLLVAAGCIPVMIVLAVILLLHTSYGTVKIELSDPSAKVEVKIDGQAIELAGLDEPLRIKAGEHGLEVTSGGFQTVTQSFTVNRGGIQLVRVKLEPKVAASPVAASRPIPERRGVPEAPRAESPLKLEEPKTEIAPAADLARAAVSRAPVPSGVQVSESRPPSAVLGASGISPGARVGGKDALPLQMPAQPPGPPALASASAAATRQPPAGASPEPPVVVSTEPGNGETSVKPGLLKVKVTFSQPMRDGCSWCSTATAVYPRREGFPHWLPDGRSCVTAFQVEPGATYAISFNTERYRNFRGENGVAAVPYVLTFSTSGSAVNHHRPHPESSAPNQNAVVASARATVVATEPKSGDAAVDPTLTEVKVTFDRPMLDHSWSWCGSPSDGYPQTTGQPHYLPDGRTCVMPVKLERGRSYSIWLNTETFGNFRDTLGRSAIPYHLTFATSGGVVPMIPKEKAALAASPASDSRGQREIVLNLGGSVKLEMVLIPAGSFLMGSSETPKQLAGAYKSYPGHFASDQAHHRVQITKPFYLGKYEVTQEQWKTVMGNNPSQFRGPKNPVQSVSWDACQQFLNRLNAKALGGTFFLPTEAQWEYACRAGSTTRFYFGDDESQLGEYAWCRANSDSKTHPVGEKKPNAWGLYDMYGNVAEWCADWYGDWDSSAYIAGSTIDDPAGPAMGDSRTVRGGDWGSQGADCRSASRDQLEPGRHIPGLGLRVARSIPE